jgi:hypothetical protein
MKYNYLLLLIITLFAGSLLNCKPEDSNTPAVDFEPDFSKQVSIHVINYQTDGAAEAIPVKTGTSVTVKIQFSAERPISKLYVNQLTNQGESCASITFDKSWTKKFVGEGCYYEIPSADAYNLTFTATIQTKSTALDGSTEVFFFDPVFNIDGGEGNAASSAAVTLVYLQSNGTGEISNNQIELGDQNNTTLGNCYASSTNVALNYATAKNSSSLVDFIFMDRSDDGKTVYNPLTLPSEGNDVYTWSKRNDTRFRVLDMEPKDFDGIKFSSDIKLLVPRGRSMDMKTELREGKVIGFITAAGKFGIARVSKVTGTPTTSGSAKLDIKIEK